MVTNTQFFNGYSSSSVSQSSLNSASGNSKTSNSTTASNINNYYSSTMTNNSKGKSNVDSKKNFSEVLNSKKESRVNDKDRRNNDKQSVTDSDKSSKIEELKSKIKELKEEVKDGNCDEKKVSDILAELLIALNSLLDKNDVSEVLNADENNDILGKLIEQLTSDNSEGNNLLQQLVEMLSSDEAQSSLGSDTLKDMKELLQQLSASLTDDSNENINKGITDIISKLDEMLQNADEQGKNTITTEELFKQGNSNQDSSMENDDNNAGMTDKKSNSKEDKFLNSLIEDKKDSVDNKINLFATRTQSVQAQNTEVRGLTINKATFADDIIKDVKFMSTNNLKELTVKVNPGNLGEITIRLVQEDGLMKANLKANSKETTALLAQNLAEIKKEIGDQNIKISEVNIELYNEDTTFFKNESFGSQLSQEQNNSKGASQNNTDVNISTSENDEVLEENLAMLDNNLDFLA